MMGVFVQVNTASRKAVGCPMGYVIQENGCWEWVGTTNGVGYGRLALNGRSQLAHRVVYEQYRGPIPAGLTLDHLCRNRACVNPAHLEAVTNRINALRGVGVGAINARKTRCPVGHLLVGDNLVPSVPTERKCRLCHNSHKRDRYALSKVNREQRGTP